MQAGSKQVQSAQGSPKQAVLSTFCIAAPNPATAAQLSREKPGNPQVDGAPRGQEKAVHTQLQNTGALSRGGRGLRIQLPGMGLEGPLGEGRFKYVAHSSQQLCHSSSSFQAQIPNPGGRRNQPLPPPPTPRRPSLGCASSFPPAPNEQSRWLG